jgi:hypothetical protein
MNTIKKTILILLLFITILSIAIATRGNVKTSLYVQDIDSTKKAVYLYTDLSEEEVEHIALEAFGAHLLAIEE